MEKLSRDDLIGLIKAVFPRFPEDKNLGILVDVPRDNSSDNAEWKNRREIALDWHRTLLYGITTLNMENIRLIAYPDVGSNNADLPETAFIIKEELPETASGLEKAGTKQSFDTLFKETQIFLALTEYSTTAPLKNAAAEYGFRAATMPGFSREMLPALRIDYNEVNRRVQLLKDKLDRAQAAEADFIVDGDREYKMFFDLRFRKAHGSSGRFPEKGTAGNLPSGEAYIVPYEGEKGESSRTEGTLPVQIGEDIALFSIKENRAYRVDGSGPAVQAEAEQLRREPAYGNMAELGFGVLEDFGLQPIGSILLDEKLGFHVAFGRSEHFGGQVGPDDFSSPKEVIHLDRIYIPTTQPRISLQSIVLSYENNIAEEIIKNNSYIIF